MVDPKEDGVVTEALKNMEEKPLDPRIIEYLYHGFQRVAESLIRVQQGADDEFSRCGEALMDILNKGGSFPNRRAFFAFGKKTMQRMVWEEWRRQQAKKRFGCHESLFEGGEEGPCNIPVAVHESYFQERFGGMNARLKALLNAFRELDPDAAATVLLRIYGYKRQEIVNHRGLTLDQVRKHLRKAKSFGVNYSED